MKIEDLKIKKTFVSSVRINNEIYEMISDQGYSLQNIIDEFIEKNVTVDFNPTTKEIIFKMK